MPPAYHQSCDRCRQQKVRCLRDNHASIAGPGRLSASMLCDRCAKAGADCVYSEKQRGHRRRCCVDSPSATKSADLFDLGPAFDGVDGTSTTSAGSSYVPTASMGGSSSDRHVEECATSTGGFAAPDAKQQQHQQHHLLPSSFENLASLLAEASTASSMQVAVPFYDDVAVAAAANNNSATLVNIEADYEDTTTCLFSQLTTVSQRAMRTARRLSRSRSGTGVGAATLMVSSPEVNEALEDTNTLISTVNDIMTSAAFAGRSDSMLTTTDSAGLACSALACHQNLMTLFRAICDAIQHQLQATREEREKQQQQQQQQQQRHHHQQQQQQQHTIRDSTSVGPLNVAQFVMVLQLLMHLISRMGRFLVSSHTPAEHEGHFITPTAMLDDNTMSNDDYAIDFVSGESGQSTALSATPTHHSMRRSSLLEHVQDIVDNIPSERERLRLIIQGLQAEMDCAEMY